ncbi:helix-turn-helix domain-containing protein [Geomonas subterranea]|uniref:helix-turn-helix domain-containing protein n=1 Tax=Geomonas subterranea TaxID=2847989 RepID=UPI001CD7083D|nr:helix-turn-helix domain-containing protein [Geomonas fuzhouensis]
MPMAEEDLEKIADMVCRRIEKQLVCKPLGVAELADFLGVEKSWVYGRRDLPFFMAGKHKRFMVKDVLEALGYAPGFKGGCDVERAA